MDTKFGSLSQLDRDYNNLVNKLKDMIPNLTDDWNDFTDADIGMFLLKTMAAIKDMQSYRFDREMLELYLPTVTQRKNLLSILQPTGYKMKSYTAAKVKIKLSKVPDKLSYGAVFKLEDSTGLGGSSLEFVYLGGEGEIDTKGSDTYVTLHQGTLNKWPSSLSENKSFKDYTDTNGNTVDKISKKSGGSLVRIAISLSDDKVAIDKTSSIRNSEGEDMGWLEVDDFVSDLSDYPISGGDSDPKIYQLLVDRDNKTYLELYNISSIPDNANSGITFNYLITEGSAGTVSKGATLVYVDDTTVSGTVEEFVSGTDPETIEFAKANVPKYVSTMDRAVTIDDYVSLIYRFLSSDSSSKFTQDTAFAINVVDNYKNDNADTSVKITDFPAEPFKVVYYVFARVGSLESEDFKSNKYMVPKIDMLPFTSGDSKSIMYKLWEYIDRRRLVGIKFYPNALPGNGEYSISKATASPKKLLRVIIKCDTSSSLTINDLKSLREALYKKYDVSNGAFGRTVSCADILFTLLSVKPILKLNMSSSISFAIVEDTVGDMSKITTVSDSDYGTTEYTSKYNEALVYGGLVIPEVKS